MTQILQSHSHSPLISLIFEENGHEVVRYFTEEKAADAAVSENATQKALGVIGAWRDLDWDETVAALDQIRHESKPTPPIKLGGVIYWILHPLPHCCLPGLLRLT